MKQDANKPSNSEGKTLMKWSSPQTIKVHFRQFSTLDDTPGVPTVSPAFTCHGDTWKLKLYPGGEKPGSSSNAIVENAKKTWIGLYLWKVSSCHPDEYTAQYSIAIPELDKTNILNERRSFNESYFWGWKEFVPRQDVLDRGCVDDILIIEVTIKISMKQYNSWSPKLYFSRRRLAMLDDNKLADITFRVVDGKRQKQILMQANSTLVLLEAPNMKHLMPKGNNNNDENGAPNETIRILDTKPAHFRAFLKFVYSDSVSFMRGDKQLADLQAMLRIASNFGCWRLKLKIEAKISDEYLTNENAISLLEFAHSNKCFMLKEACLTVAQVPVLNKFLLEECSSRCNQDPALIQEIRQYLSGEYWDDGVNDNFSKMCVGELYGAIETEQKKAAFDSDLSRAELLELVRK